MSGFDRGIGSGTIDVHCDREDAALAVSLKDEMNLRVASPSRY
jgi:hypothetical protein